MLDVAFTVGPNVNISASPGIEAEATIAVDPTNSARLFAASNRLTAPGVSSLAAWYSTDAGATWTSSNLAGLPTTFSDAQAAFDHFGNLYLVHLTPAPPTATTVVALSTDAGQSFRTLATFGGGPGNGTEQPSVATGPGSVWVTFQNGSGGISAAGASVTGFNQVGPFSNLQLAPGSCEVFPECGLTSGWTGNFGSIAIGPTGQVMVTYQEFYFFDHPNRPGPSRIYVNVDPDGLGPKPFGPRILATETNVGSVAPIPAQPVRAIDAEANLAWDRRDGFPGGNGRVYLVYTGRSEVSSDDTDIFVRLSDDNGMTWDDPVRVNDDGTMNSQFNPAIAVDQTTGLLAVTWYDARNSPGNNTVQLWGSVSEDTGRTFSANVQISAGTSSGLKAGFFEFGDYDTMDFVNGVFYRAWADNSSPSSLNPPNPDLPTTDVATARVSVENFAPAGFADPARRSPRAPANVQASSTAFARLVSRDTAPDRTTAVPFLDRLAASLALSRTWPNWPSIPAEAVAEIFTGTAAPPPLDAARTDQISAVPYEEAHGLAVSDLKAGVLNPADEFADYDSGGRWRWTAGVCGRIDPFDPEDSSFCREILT